MPPEPLPWDRKEDKLSSTLDFQEHRDKCYNPLRRDETHERLAGLALHESVQVLKDYPSHMPIKKVNLFRFPGDINCRSLSDVQSLPKSQMNVHGNYSAPSTKMEQPPLQGIGKSNEQNMNGVSVFPSLEISGTSGVIDYRMYMNSNGAKVTPFTLNVKQQHNVLSEMQRRNGYETLPVLQQHGTGMVGMNVVGRAAGIVVGGGSCSCTGISVLWQQLKCTMRAINLGTMIGVSSKKRSIGEAMEMWTRSISNMSAGLLSEVLPLAAILLRCCILNYSFV